MKIYEESGSVQQQVGGGGFNPVQEPDVASAMERELRAGERRDQLFYNSVTQNNQYKVQEAQAVAERMNNQIDQNLKAISQFSKTANQILDQRTVNKINQDMEAAAQQAWIDPIYAEQETEKFEQDESKIEEGQTIMNEAAVKYEANGGSPIIGEGLRTQFTGRNRVAYERARMERLSYEFPSYYASKLSEINATQDPDVRAARELAVVNQFLRETGAAGTSPGMLNKYLMRNMREVTAKAQLAWTTETEKGILAGRIDEAQSELWTGMTSGNISSASSTFLTKMQSLGKTPLEAKQELFNFLESNEKQLSTSDIDQLDGTPIDHPAGDTFGKVFGKELDSLRGKVVNNQNLMLQRSAQEREAKAADYKNRFIQLNADKIASGEGPMDAAAVAEYRKIGEAAGFDTSFLDDHVTKEAMPIEVGKRALESIWQKEGFLTPNDLEPYPDALKQDADVQKWLKDGSLRSGESKIQREALEKSVTRLATEVTGYNVTTGKKGVGYDNAERNIRKALTAQYMANLQSGKYRNEDGSLNYDQALGDAVATIDAGASKLGSEDDTKIDYTKSPGQADIATRGSARYQQKLSIYKNEMKDKGTEFITGTLFSSQSDLDQAQDALMGRGNYPAIYEDLAAGQRNVTPYDIAQAQLAKAGRKLEPPRVEQAVKEQDPYTQQLLNYKPNINRTERAFTPSFNDPSVVTNYKMVEGGALKGLTEDDYKWLAYTITSEAALGTDDEYMVAASIINRYADPTWNRGAKGIKDIIMAAGQYEGVYKGLSRHDSSLTQRLMSPEGQNKIVQMLRVLKGRQDFKGQSELRNRDTANDPMAHPKGNFFHYTGQRAKGAWRGAIPTYYTRFIR